MADWQVINNQNFVLDIGALPIEKTFFFQLERGPPFYTVHLFMESIGC